MQGPTSHLAVLKNIRDAIRLVITLVENIQRNFSNHRLAGVVVEMSGTPSYLYHKDLELWAGEGLNLGCVTIG